MLCYLNRWRVNFPLLMTRISILRLPESGRAKSGRKYADACIRDKP